MLWIWLSLLLFSQRKKIYFIIHESINLTFISFQLLLIYGWRWIPCFWIIIKLNHLLAPRSEQFQKKEVTPCGVKIASTASHSEVKIEEGCEQYRTHEVKNIKLLTECVINFPIWPAIPFLLTRNSSSSTELSRLRTIENWYFSIKTVSQPELSISNLNRCEDWRYVKFTRVLCFGDFLTLHAHSHTHTHSHARASIQCERCCPTCFVQFNVHVMRVCVSAMSGSHVWHLAETLNWHLLIISFYIFWWTEKDVYDEGIVIKIIFPQEILAKMFEFCCKRIDQMTIDSNLCAFWQFFCGWLEYFVIYFDSIETNADERTRTLCVWCDVPKVILCVRVVFGAAHSNVCSMHL